MKNKIGAHLPGGKDLTRAFPLMKELQVEAVQVFLNSPTTYKTVVPDPGKDEEFRAYTTENKIDVFVHGPYLMNFGSAKPASRAAAQKLLRANLTRAKNIGAKGVVLHAGSSTGDPLNEGLERMSEALTPVLNELTVNDPNVLLEPMAGQNNMLASTVTSIPAYLEAVDNHEKLLICLDTAHLWAAGENLSIRESVRTVLDKFGALVGFDRLALVHANDSKASMGSKLDRHENFHLGQMGVPVLEELFADGRVICPLVLETPSDGHATDLTLMRAVRGRLTSSAG